MGTSFYNPVVVPFPTTVKPHGGPVGLNVAPYDPHLLKGIHRSMLSSNCAFSEIIHSASIGCLKFCPLQWMWTLGRSSFRKTLLCLARVHIVGCRSLHFVARNGCSGQSVFDESLRWEDEDDADWLTWLMPCFRSSRSPSLFAVGDSSKVWSRTGGDEQVWR
jgi:hypothetical protein